VFKWAVDSILPYLIPRFNYERYPCKQCVKSALLLIFTYIRFLINHLKPIGICVPTAVTLRNSAYTECPFYRVTENDSFIA
jgi:hypothetical protein